MQPSVNKELQMRFESDREEAKSPIIMLVEVGLFVAAAILAVALLSLI